jgi:hypothetical protein
MEVFEMTVALGGIALSDELVLDIGQPEIGFSSRRLIGGANVVQVDGVSGGRTMTLEGINHWTFSQSEQIRSLQAGGQAVTLEHHRGMYQVVIIDTSDLVPTRKYKNPVADTMYTGSITLIEVS